MRNECGDIIAGLNGNVVFGSIYIDQLWVKYRRQGLGEQLMNKVDAYGKKVGCHIATIYTMSFQNAKSFHERLGYEVDFELHGYVQNSFMLLMKKIIV